MLRDFEKSVCELLLSGILQPFRITEIVNNAEFKDYEYTGSGYFIKISHPFLPQERIVCSKPTVFGRSDGIECGFVIFIENGELTLECHSWGERDVPADFRNRDVRVSFE
jgi:hypothetical protein